MTEEIKPEVQKVISEIDEVKRTHLELKATNDAMEAEINRRETLRAQAMIAGRSQATPPATKVETPTDYAKAILAGRLNDRRREN